MSQLSFAPALSIAARNANLLRHLVRRDFQARFTGSALGLGWAVLQPLMLVILYWFVFSFMIPQGPGAANGDYAYFLIAGLVPWIGFSEGLMRSTTTIVDNASMVRRLAFQSELLIIVPNASAMILESIGFGLFLLFLAFSRGLTPQLWLLPLAMALQFVIQVGIGWILATFYVFFRDLAQILGFVLSIVFYLSPILYPVSHRFARVFDWNPLTPLLGLFRSASIGGPIPSLSSIVFVVVVAAVVFCGGGLFFRRAQGTLADLI